jgi:uncharacterized RDD family membrane protein YckC
MNISVPTSQNVTIEYEVAGIGTRIGAFLLDMLVLFGWMILGWLIVGYALGGDASSIVILLLTLPVFFYPLLCELFLEGQTFGKKWLQIRVVKLDGTQPGLGSYLLRWILWPIDIMLFSGLIAIVTILINARGQRLGDIAAGTTVISLKPRAALADTIYTAVDEEYTPRFPEVASLTDHDMAIIKDLLEQSRRERNPQMLTALATRVRTLLDVDPTPLTPLEFVRTVVKDYNAVSGR